MSIVELSRLDDGKVPIGVISGGIDASRAVADHRSMRRRLLRDGDDERDHSKR